MNRTEILDYAKTHGSEAAADLLLLLGPDGYSHSYEDYMYLMTSLTGDVDAAQDSSSHGEIR